MTRETLTGILEELKRGAFISDWCLYEFSEPPKLSFAVYLEKDAEHVFADNRTLSTTNGWRVELYTRHKNLALEERFEELLSGHAWVRFATVKTPDQGAMLTAYEIGGGHD